MSKEKPTKKDLIRIEKEALAELREASCRPPKKKTCIGTLNFLTGEVTHRRFPDFLVLSPSNYDQLLALARWVDATPDCVEIPDHTWELIHETMLDFVWLDEDQWPDVQFDSVQIETVETAQRNIAPGTLVVLLTHDDQGGDETEHHCVLVRSAEEDHAHDPDYNK